MTEMPTIEALEKIGPADVYRLFETTTIHELARLKFTDRSSYEKLKAKWRGNKVPNLLEVDRLVDQAIKTGKARAAGTKAERAKAEGMVIIDYTRPLDTARMFAEARRPTLLHHNGEWLDHDGSCYVPIEERALMQNLSRFLDGGMAVVQKGVEPIKQTPQLLTAVIDMLKTEAHRGHDAFAPPCWLDQKSGDPPAGEMLACGNGLVHMPTGFPVNSTPRFFTRNALEFDCDPWAASPTRFLQFLEELWPDSSEDIAMLREADVRLSQGKTVGENGYCESFNGKLRDELLNGEIFYTLKEAQVLIEWWRRHYNQLRPHSSLGYRPPAPEASLPIVPTPTYHQSVSAMVPT